MQSWLGRISVIVFGLFFCGAVFLFNQAAQSSVQMKLFAEKQMAAALGVPVAIESAEIGFLNHISFKNLVVESPPSQELYFGARQLSLRYNLLKLITRDFSKPSKLLLRSPHLVLASYDGVPNLLKAFSFASDSRSLTGIEISEGRFDFNSASRYPIRLSGIHGSLKPFGIGKISVAFTALSEGTLQGQIRVVGTLDLIRRSQMLHIYLDEVSSEAGTGLPLVNASGEIVWKNDRLEVIDLNTQIQGHSVAISGEIERLKDEPVIRLDLKFGDIAKESEVSLLVDFKTREIKGGFHGRNKAVKLFSGEIEKKNGNILLHSFTFDRRFHAEGFMKISTGDYHFNLRSGKQRAELKSNVLSKELGLTLQIEHFEIEGLDVVARLKLRLSPDSSKVLSRVKGYNVAFKTDYFILETLPFDDLNGSFYLTSRAINSIKASWGNSFELGGSISLHKGKPDAKLVLKIEAFNLSRVRNFIDKPLNKSIGGLVRGRVKIKGPFKRAEVIADLNVRQGWVGNLMYDVATVRARGFLPYLPLSESQVMKGRISLDLTGALDFSLPNPFHGVQLRTLDKIVLWNGWNLNANAAEGDIQIGRWMQSFPALSLRAGNVNTVDREGFHEEGYLTVGSNLKF